MHTPRARCAMLILLAVTVAVAPGFGQTSPQPPQLPLQHIVFVIDNSGSMEMGPMPSDPLRLRGVAASLVLDAAELSSEVKAGLVFFSDSGQTDGQLHPPDIIRQRLQADRLPEAQGATNMEDGLAKALALLSGSTAAIKRIVMITDGFPSDAMGNRSTSQERAIRENLVPHAKQAGIQIFALGLSQQVDRAFLDQITVPTEGKTLVSEQHQKLLRSAKELIGDRDNVFTLAYEPLPATQSEYQFELPPGVDRARLTAILDQPQVFAPGEIELSLEGPDAGDGGRPYIVRAAEANRVAAWTLFFSAPGKYTLRTTVSKPGATGHLGLQLFLEALSSLRVQVLLNPPSDRRLFGDEVKVDVQAATGSGSLDPADLKVSGSVRTPGGGSEPISFSGTQGLFRVPDVEGRHAVVVKVETSQKLGRAEARVEYEAMLLPPAELKSSRDELAFVRALGPEQPQVEESFKVYADFPEGARPRAVKIAVTLNSPVGVAELVRRDGGSLRINGTASYPLLPEGMELVLRIKLDPKRPLTTQAGKKHVGELRIFSSDASELVIPFRLEIRIPRFELKGKRDAFALWWDPRQARTVDLGRLHTDLSQASTFSIILPEAIHAPDQGPKIADLALRAGENTPEPERLEEGKLRYGPIELPPGQDIAIELVVTPVSETGWERLAASGQPIEVRLTSNLGMETVAKPTFWNVGGPAFSLPLLGTLSWHGRHAVTVLVLVLGLLIALLLTWRRARIVKRFWPFRPGRLLTLGSGPIQIGEVGVGGSASLLLPSSGSELDDSTLGRVSLEGRGQRVEDSSGRLVLKDVRLSSPAKLSPGDLLGVVDPKDPDGNDRLWEVEYLDFEPGEGGEIEVVTSPAPWTLKRLLGRLTLSLTFLFLLQLLLGWGSLAALAYGLPLIETFYVRVLLP